VSAGLSEADIPRLNPERMARIRTLLAEALDPVVLDVTDDSHKHAGHAGARTGQGHFSVHVVSQAFAGKLPLARHRLVYAALGAMMETDIHALSIHAKAPDEAA
jgi:BolA family transcriptional regulator, general stress-responsive regulator